MKSGLITIGIIILLTAGLFWVSRNQPVNNQVANNTEVDPKGQGERTNPLLYKVKLIPPQGWRVEETFPNGLVFGSPDLEMNAEEKTITKGSTLTLIVTQDAPWATLDDVMASKTGNGVKPTNVRNITIDGEKAVQYTHNTLNAHTVMHVILDGNVYTVDQAYALNSANPYPKVFSDLIASLKLPR